MKNNPDSQNPEHAKKKSLDERIEGMRKDDERKIKQWEIDELKRQIEMWKEHLDKWKHIEERERDREVQAEIERLEARLRELEEQE